MSDRYINSMLGEREHVLLVTRQHWFVLFSAIIFEVIVALVIVAVLTGVLFFLLPSPIVGFGYILLIIPFIALIHDALVWSNRKYVITNRRVIQVVGIFNKSVTDSSLDKVNDVKMVQPFWGRIFDFGDVEILTASELGVNLFHKIGDPIKFKTTMLNAKETQDREMSGHSDEEPVGATRLLEDLDNLRRQGVLTEAEFQNKKAEILKKV